MAPTHRYYGEDFCVMEHDATATVEGEFLGVPGHGKRITFGSCTCGSSVTV